MELRVSLSTQEPGMSLDHDDKEISDDDDDRNHKHRRRYDTRSHSLENDDVTPRVFTTKPYRRGSSKPSFQNGHPYKGPDAHSYETWKKYGFTPTEKDSKFDQKRQGFTHSNQKIRGRESSQPFSVDPHSLFANSHAPSSWSQQPFGLVQGIPNTNHNMIHHPLGLQGTFRPNIINPSSLDMGIARKRCRDFEEQGFCLRGDMCPMEHGVNRIVVEDVQSLSQFNLPISLPTTTLSIAPAGTGPSRSTIITTTNTLSNSSKSFHGKNIIKHIDSTITTSDFYDPDQPLWGNNSHHTPPVPQSTNQPNVSFLDPSQPVDFDNEVLVSTSGTAGTQSTRSYAQGTSKKRRELDNEIVTENGVKIEGKNGRMIRKPSQKAECTLFVNGIPQENNKRETLISHFKRFGEVIDVHIPMNSERAFVQFSKRQEAEAALMAPDAVMGNRFIKLWWANRDNVNNVPCKRKEDSRLALQNDVIAPVKGNGVKVVVVPPLKKKLENLEVLKEELRKKQEMLDQKRDDFRRKLDKLAKQATGLKGEMLPEHVAKKQKLLLLNDSVKAATPSSTIDDVAANISKSLDSSQNSKTTLASALQDSPKVKPSWPHVDSPVVTKRFKLDNRPTAFQIIPPLPDGLADIAVLKEHFSTYGDFSKVQLDEKTPKHSARIYFTTRLAAEKAFLNAKNWKGHNLQFTWLISNASNQPLVEIPKTDSQKQCKSGDGELEKREIVKESNQSDLSKP